MELAHCNSAENCVAAEKVGFKMAFVKALWRGEISLVFTYWVMGALVVTIFRLYNIYLYEYGINDATTGNALFLILLFGATTTAYSIFILICIWRSAGNYIEEAQRDVGKFGKKPIWGTLARAAVVIGGLNVVADLIGFRQV